MRFKCKVCKIDISIDLEKLEDITNLSEEDGQDLVPHGFFIISDGSFFSLHKGDECIFDTAEKIIISRSDMVNWETHDNPSRCNGCCGLDGLDGINVMCANGHEIGTLKADCWMGHGFILEPDLTEMKG